MKYFPLTIVLFAFVCYAQNWSGVIANSRATDWTNAGLPSALPDGETAVNPWTPPVRSTVCATLSSTTTIAAINSALSSCPAGEVVKLSAGTFTFSSGTITLGNQNYVTLRGSGADQTIFKCSGSCGFTWYDGGSQVSEAWTGGFSQDATSVTVSANPGASANRTDVLYANGLTSDNGGVFVCANTSCSTEGGSNDQGQVTLTTGGSGTSWNIWSGTYSNLPTGIYMPNWSGLGSPNVTWLPTATGTGLEDMTLDFTGNTGNAQVFIDDCYACWVKGNRIINGNNYQIQTQNSKNYLISNNYFYGATTLVSSPPGGIDFNTDSDGLILNNIGQLSTFYWQGTAVDDVLAYNYLRDAYSNSGSQCYPPVIVSHEAGVSFALLEGNETGSLQMDDIHGTQNLDTFFRNLASSNDPPYTSGCNPGAIQVDGYARFMNIVGNVLGSGTTTNYQSTSSTFKSTPIYIIGTDGSAAVTDSLAFSSSLRWGNYDVVTAATRWCGNSSSPGWSTTCSSVSEVPTSLSGYAAPFQNPVPATTTLPASFFIPATTTQLSWWGVCTNYPTCSTSQTQPFPPIGPDVSGGGPVIGNATDIYGGHAYDVPAAIAWEDLPVDTAYQASYSVTGSIWSGGTETLTISGGFPGGFTPKGEFQVTGKCAGTFVMSSSTNTTVSYAASSNPGSCTGASMLYPDVRVFNETVYSSASVDGTTTTKPSPPGSVGAAYTTPPQ